MRKNTPLVDWRYTMSAPDNRFQVNKSYEIIIIGAGIIGLCTAYQISRRSRASILVLEQGAQLGEGSTGASSAVCRHRYSLDDMLVLARDGIDAYRNWPAFLEMQQPLAEFQNDGVLWITGKGRTWAESEQARMAEHAIAAEVLTSDEVRNRFPALSTCIVEPDLEHGAAHDCTDDSGYLFETDGGFFDPVNALNDLYQVLKQKNVEIQFQSKVAALDLPGGKVHGVRLASGETITADCVVNASGPWCNEILDDIGFEIPWPLKPTRIQIIHLDKPPEMSGKIPVTCDLAGGIYFREQNRGQQIVVGSTLEQDEREVVDPSDYKTYIDDDFKHAKLHALHHRIPTLPYRGSVKGYTGLYTVNQEDVHPVVGKTPVDGFYIANGFSGHGFKLGPAIGSLLAQAITGDTADYDTTVSPEFLAFDRAPLSVDAKNVLA